MLFKGNSSKLELLIEKIQANKENGTGSEAGNVAHEEVSVGGSSWDVGSDGRGSLSPASSATPTSASETDVEAAATVGVTQSTPYQCSFCDRAFPRLSYLKRHEQLHGIYPKKAWPSISACSPMHVLSSVIESSSPSEKSAGMGTKVGGGMGKETLDETREPRRYASPRAETEKKVTEARGAGPPSPSPYTPDRMCCTEGRSCQFTSFSRGSHWPDPFTESSDQGNECRFEENEFPSCNCRFRGKAREGPCQVRKEGIESHDSETSLQRLALLDTWLARGASLVGSRSPSNVWTEDNVVNYVERELKEMQDQHTAARVAESISISEEVFHFVEMELRRLNADIDLENTPPSASRSALPYEVLRTPPEQLPTRIHRDSFSSPLPSEYGSDGDIIARLTHSESSHDGDGFAGDTPTTIESLGNESRDTKALQPVLCLKHLDQLPTSLCHYSQTPVTSSGNTVPCPTPLPTNLVVSAEVSSASRKTHNKPSEKFAKPVHGLHSKTELKYPRSNNLDTFNYRQTRQLYIQKVKGKKRERQKYKRKLRGIQKGLRETQTDLERKPKEAHVIKLEQNDLVQNLEKSQTNSLSVQIPLSRVSLRRNLGNKQEGHRSNTKISRSSEKEDVIASRFKSPSKVSSMQFTPESEETSRNFAHAQDFLPKPFPSAVCPPTLAFPNQTLQVSEIPRRLPPTPLSPGKERKSKRQSDVGLPPNPMPYRLRESKDTHGYIPFVQPYNCSVYPHWQTFPYPHMSSELGMNNLPCQTLCTVPFHTAIPWQHNVTPPHAISTGVQGFCLPYLGLSGRPPPGESADSSWSSLAAVYTPPNSCPPGRLKVCPKSSLWQQNESPFLMETDICARLGSQKCQMVKVTPDTTKELKITHTKPERICRSSEQGIGALHIQVRTGALAEQRGKSRAILSRLDHQKQKSASRVIQVSTREKPRRRDETEKDLNPYTKFGNGKADGSDTNNNNCQVPKISHPPQESSTCNVSESIKSAIQPVVKCNQSLQNVSVQYATDESFPVKVAGDCNKFRYVNEDSTDVTPTRLSSNGFDYKLDIPQNNTSPQFPSPKREPGDRSTSVKRCHTHHPYILPKKRHKNVFRSLSKVADTCGDNNQSFNNSNEPARVEIQYPCLDRKSEDEDSTYRNSKDTERRNIIGKASLYKQNLDVPCILQINENKQSNFTNNNNDDQKEGHGGCVLKGNCSDTSDAKLNFEEEIDDCQGHLFSSDIPKRKTETVQANIHSSPCLSDEASLPSTANEVVQMPAPLPPTLPTITVSPSSIVRQGAHFGLIRKIAPCLLRPNPRKVLSRKGSLMNRYLANRKRQMSFLNRRAAVSPKRVKRSKLNFGASLGYSSQKDAEGSTPQREDLSTQVSMEGDGENVTIYSTSGKEKTTINREGLPRDFCASLNSGEDVDDFRIFQECLQSTSDKDGTRCAGSVQVNSSQVFDSQPKNKDKISFSMHEPDYADVSVVEAELQGSEGEVANAVSLPSEHVTATEFFTNCTFSISSDEVADAHDMNSNELTPIANISIKEFQEEEKLEPTVMSILDNPGIAKPEQKNRVKEFMAATPETETIGIPNVEWETFTCISDQCPEDGAMLTASMTSLDGCVQGKASPTEEMKSPDDICLPLEGIVEGHTMAIPRTCQDLDYLEARQTASNEHEVPGKHQDLLALALRADLLDVLTADSSWPEVTLAGTAEEPANPWETSFLTTNIDPSSLCLREGIESQGKDDRGVSPMNDRPARILSWDDEQGRLEDMESGESADGQNSCLIPCEAPWSPQQRDSSSSSCSSSVAEEFEEVEEVPLESREDEGSGGGGSGAEYEPREIKKEGGGGGERRRRRRGKSSYLIEVLTHADQLPFRCEFCGRLFKHKRSRDRHVKLHTGDKKYKCCHCEAAFSRSDHLKIHMKTHDTQKPYQCSVCNRGYNTAAALTAHMQNHKAKLTAHALSQLLKDAQAPSDTHALTQLLKDSTVAETHAHQALNSFLKDAQKEQLISPKSAHDVVAGSSPVALTASPGAEASPALSPVATVRCPVCHAHCRNHTHLQRHLSRYHGDESALAPSERPASRGGGSGGSSVGGASSATSTPSPRPPSSLPSPRPLANPLLSLVGGKLACLYCSRDGFPSLEALQLHLHSTHGSVLNGEVREMTNLLGLPTSLGGSLGAAGLAASLASPLGPGSSRSVSCELCGARVSGVTALQRHVVTAHTFTDLLARAAEGVFCAQCLLPFSNPGALAEHIKLVHAAPPALSAVLNKRPPSPPTDTPTDLSKKSRHDAGLTVPDLPASTLLCSQCNAPFTNFEAFRRHLKSHLEGRVEQVGASADAQLVCPECRLPLDSETALEAHLATHLGATATEYGCQACLKLFAKPDELQKHLMDIHAHHLYRCALCKEMFDSKVSIQVHFAVKHSNECKVHKCTRCSLLFRSQAEFEVHIRASHVRRVGLGVGGESASSGGGSLGVGGGGSYRCLLCTLSLSSEAELAAHVATHQRQFQCTLCDDAFHVEFLLDKHMQTQHNSELNGNVPQPENLVKPRRSPHKKELKCDICDAEFSSDSGLLTHRKQAHNIKSGSAGAGAKVAAASLSLFCAYCSEACKSRSDLEAHMKSHQGSGGRHKCNICDELCPSAALLAQHKLTHVKVVSGSACAVCREPLTSEQQFSSHQSEHHPAPLPQPCVVCRQTLVTDMEVSVHARFHAAQAAQAAAAASVAASCGAFSSGELMPPASNASLITTTAAMSGVTTSSNSSSSRGSISPRQSPSLRCPECHLKLETIEEAEAHAAVHQHHQTQQQQQHQGYGRSVAASSRTYQCIKCQESFASEAEIEAHVASHLLHEGSVHECHLCRATFDTPLRLQCHLIEHTFEGCGSFTCYMCSSVFTTASRLQQHMVEHGLSARPYDCHHCHQRFFFRAELENHALSHPEAADGGCRECVASFPDLPRRNLRRPSLSCLTPQHIAAQTRPPSPCSPCYGDATDAAPTPANGHAPAASAEGSDK